MTDQLIRIEQIGALASDILSCQRIFKLMGETSRGYFLHSAENKIVFLTSDPFRGPYTLNLSSKITCEIEPGQSVEVAGKKIHLPDCQVLDYSQAVVWVPSVFEMPDADPDLMNEIIECSTFAFAEGKHSLADLLGVLLKHEGSSALSVEQETILNTLIYFRKSLHAGETNKATFALLSILGLGRGLTPSADDLICGMLLYWKRHCRSNKYSHIEKSLPDLIKSKQLETTSVSYQLLCAAQMGMADERVIQALDLLMMGSTDTVKIYQLLSAYGNSSGLDLFTGWVVGYLLNQ